MPIMPPLPPTLVYGQFGPQEYDWQDLYKGPLDIASY